MESWVTTWALTTARLPKTSFSGRTDLGCSNSWMRMVVCSGTLRLESGRSFGWDTSRQESNHPASHGGKGLEVDKMSAEAMDFYWEHFLEQVVRLAGDRAGKVFHNFLIDSFEAGHQNWTAGLDQLFIDRHGYDLKKLLPILTGRIVGSVEYTERVLWDYRKLIGELITENYYGRMAERCADVGLQFSAEPYGRFGNMNDFDVAGKVELPACEWWAYRDDTGWIGEARLAATAHTYGRRRRRSLHGRPEAYF